MTARPEISTTHTRARVYTHVNVNVNAQVGNPGTRGQLPIYRQQAHFALWALMKSPLLIGTDLRNIAPESLDILLAAEVIAINQDPLGVPGDLIFQHGPKQVRQCPVLLF